MCFCVIVLKTALGIEDGVCACECFIPGLEAPVVKAVVLDALLIALAALSAYFVESL